LGADVLGDKWADAILTMSISDLSDLRQTVALG
jgi:hypothetical protein